MKIEKFIMPKLSMGVPPIIRVWRTGFVVVISGGYWGSEFCMENFGALFLLPPRSCWEALGVCSQDGRQGNLSLGLKQLAGAPLYDKTITDCYHKKTIPTSLCFKGEVHQLLR